MLNNKKIVVVLPAYNAEKTLEITYNEIPFDIVDEVVLVDDASSDATIDVANKIGDKKILEAGFNSLANHHFATISREVREEIGLPLAHTVFPRWQNWLNETIKKRKI